jgi:hypothetical protein
MDVVFSAAAKQGRLAPLTQFVPHCGESEGGPHEGRATLTKAGERGFSGRWRCENDSEMGCFQGIATICEQPRYDLEHESPITTWDIGAQLFVIVP